MGTFVKKLLEQKDNAIEEAINYDENKNNLPLPNIFGLFDNASTLVIKTTSSDGNYSYDLSMPALLELICECSLKEVIIKAMNNDMSGRCWLTYSGISESETKAAYNAKGYDIKLERL